MKKLLLSVALLTAFNVAVFSQDDEAGCKDHAMLTRMPSYYISACSKSFNQLEIPVGMSSGEQNRKTLEGNVSSIEYNRKEDQEGKLPSWFQIIKNYENALAKIGGKKVYSDVQSATFQIVGASKDAWISLDLNSSDADGVNVYSFVAKIIEMEAMTQDIQSTEIFQKLSAEGHIALYINFETGKSDIKPESQKVIDEMAEMLNNNATLKVSIEGHTDNVGTTANNKTLSESRARAVMNALIAKGIDKGRLSSKGWGQEKPVADNITDEGKAKNRRVEIVKM
ncbi:MAG: OmpA family protein [bacterium]|nr:OmpA family protein [bacterium]